MTIREQILAGEMPSQVVADLRRSGSTWQETTRDFILSFPETHTAISSNVRILGQGMYSREPGSLEVLDYMILKELSAAGLPVKLPAKPF